MKDYPLTDTICALSSPPGTGAIALIRMSGTKVLEIADKIFRGGSVTRQKANTVQLRELWSGDIKIDEVLLTLFRAPKSYTGEDLVEISCHGSGFIQSEILKSLVNNGARMAKEGEFTYRAFMNGKMDLSQAEAVADLIASDSRAARDIALNQLKKGYAEGLKELRAKLVHFASLVELELDFSEEDVDFVNRKELGELLDELKGSIAKLIVSFNLGNAMKEGISVVIIGEPNAGKSTLLNRILNEDRAIVSEIPGTTRDSIEDVVNLDGIAFRFIDTAGLRETKDVVEDLGIRRALEKASSAKVIIQLTDGNLRGERTVEEIKSSSGMIGSVRHLLVFNKIDKLEKSGLKDLEKKAGSAKDVFLISAKEDIGVDEMLRSLRADYDLIGGKGEGMIVSNLRHLEALKKCDASLDATISGLQSQKSGDLLAQDLRQALYYLGEITGEVTNDELLENIFSKFCIGK